MSRSSFSHHMLSKFPWVLESSVFLGPSSHWLAYSGRQLQSSNRDLWIQGKCWAYVCTCRHSWDPHMARQTMYSHQSGRHSLVKVLKIQPRVENSSREQFQWRLGIPVLGLRTIPSNRELSGPGMSGRAGQGDAYLCNVHVQWATLTEFNGLLNSQ